MKRTFASLALAAATLLSTMAHGHDNIHLPDRITVPLVLSPGSEYGQSFVRLRAGFYGAQMVSVTAIDDAGTVSGAFNIPQLLRGESFHFNSNDLADGNAAKGIEGMGQPMGNWRLQINAAIGIVAVLSYIRTPDGFLTPMHDYRTTGPFEEALRIDTFNPASNVDRQSRLRLINPSFNEVGVEIYAVDDSGAVRPGVRTVDGFREVETISLTLPAGQARMLTAVDLEEGAHGLEGTLGDGAGKWELRIDVTGEGASDEDWVIVQNLLYSSSGHVSNLSARGAQAERDVGDIAFTAYPVHLSVEPIEHTSGIRSLAGGLAYLHTESVIVNRETGPLGDSDWYRLTISESGRLTVQMRARESTFGGLSEHPPIGYFVSGELHRDSDPHTRWPAGAPLGRIGAMALSTNLLSWTSNEATTLPIYFLASRTIAYTPSTTTRFSP